MSNRWPGGVIRKTPVTPAGPLQNGAASGVWTLADAAYWTKQGLWPLAGNTLVVEDVFSTYLYTGNGSTQTITNGINLSGSGGLVWTKNRVDAQWHCLADTTRGLGNNLFTNSTDPNQFQATGITSASSTGYTIGTWSGINTSSQNHVSWTFREAPKFFDVVTYTGNGVAGRQIAHNLGVAPGMMIVKRLNNPENWDVYHRSVGATGELRLNQDAGTFTDIQFWNNTEPTASVFTVGTNSGINANGGTYVAYLFAHDAASDGIIQCGSYTGNGSTTGPTVTLGWEPQWFMVKRASGGTSNWQIIDNMRGMPVGSADATLWPNSANGETSAEYVSPNATGFQVVSTSSEVNTSGNTYIYVAIRRGPMKTPTLGTSVFNATFGTGGGTPWFKSGFPVDFGLFPYRLSGNASWNGSRLTGETYMAVTTTAAEASDPSQKWDYMNGWRSDTTANSNYIGYGFRRAPGFMDVVCYTTIGIGTNQIINHNLGVVPELVITKCRSTAGYGWTVSANFTSTTCSEGQLNTTAAIGQYAYTLGTWINQLPTATQMRLYGEEAGRTWVSYLFASVPGVSKVGGYTGNGSSQTLNCAFTTGARFVLIKRTDSTGGWLVWDSARGIVAGNDPYLALNSTAAEVTTDDSVDTDSTGFVVNQVAASNINVNGATYIFLAIA